MRKFFGALCGNRLFYKVRCAVFCGIPLLVLAGCGRAGKPARVPVPEVVVSSPLQRDVPVLAEAIGQTEATANVEVRARVESTVQRITFTEGTEVSAGAPLFELDRKIVEQKLAAAKGNQARLQAVFDRAAQEVRRMRPLAEKNVVSQRELDNVLAQQNQAGAALETGTAEVRAAELDLGYTHVTAPVTGIIGAKQVDVGTLVGRGQSTVLATISPLDPIWVNVEVSEVTYLNSAGRFRESKDPKDSPAFSLLLANGAVHPHPGHLIFVDRAVNSSTGTLRVRVEFPNPDKLLRPGQFCRVRVHTRTVPNALLVPQRAVQELQGLHNLFVVGAEGKVGYRRVRMGMRVGSLWVVESGLESGESVVVEGLQKVREGMAVHARKADIDEASWRDLMAQLPTALKQTTPEPR
jgi:membrane fusion protein (multidrug efflux system)